MNFLKTKNWQTSTFGALTLLTTAFKIYVNRGIEPQDMATIAAGIGLILAKDSQVTGGAIRQ